MASASPDDQLMRRLLDGRDQVTRTVIVANVGSGLLIMGPNHDDKLRRLARHAAPGRKAEVARLASDDPELLLQRGVQGRAAQPLDDHPGCAVAQ